MENKTAIEWFAERIQSDKIFSFERVFEKAKEMEKQQFIDFFMWFRDNGERYLGLSIEKFIEEYYNQKFNNHEKN